MLVIGITGPSGAGKSQVSAILKKFGFKIIDADTVAREVTSKGSICLWELTRSFGDILDDNKELDRAVLSEIVFSNEESLALLNEITHKHIIENINYKLDELNKQGFSKVCIDAAALIESGYNVKCDFVITVIAPLPLRLERILKRDNLSKDAALLRLLAQHSDEYYINQSNYIIDNIDDTKLLEQNVKEFLISNEIE